MFFTLIIPAYNPQWIIRLFESIIRQQEPDLLVIVCDDRKDEELKDITELYEMRLHIKYCHTKNHTIHQPGNTRMDAMEYVPDDTKYVFFADDDDFFDDGALPKIKQAIIDNNYPPFIMTDIYSTVLNDDATNPWDITQFHNVKKLDLSVFLHGNFYSWKYLKDNNITFKENISSTEDGYFNNMVVNQLLVDDIPVSKLDFPFYHWVARNSSISNSNRDTAGEEYIETYMDGFLTAAIEPPVIFYKRYPEQRKEFFGQCASSLLCAYFYYQYSLYNRHDKSLEVNLKRIREACDYICEVFQANKQEVIEVIYSDYEKYNKQRDTVQLMGYSFIEEQSFKDFINSL